MPSTHELGSIPTLAVWSGDLLAFTVTSSLGAGATFSAAATPRPAGALAIDAKTGAFTYAPSDADRETLDVAIAATLGDRTQEQVVAITPTPRLPSEWNVISHSAPIPEAHSSLYVTTSTEPLGKAVFNNEADYEDEEGAKVELRRVTVSGVQLVLEAQSISFPLYDRLEGRTDIRELVLCADEVVIRSPVRVPGADVRIYARSLRFEGAGASGGMIDTSPRAVTVRASKRGEGLRGQRAGSVWLHVRDLDLGAATVRVRAAGAPGQPARSGIAGAKGKSIEPWNGKAVTVTWWAGNEELDWSDELKSLPNASGYKTLHAEIWSYYAPGIGGPWFKEFTRGTKDWPTDGEPPKLLPGMPGQGGDGGSVYARGATELKSRVELGAGRPGDRAAALDPSPAGTPVKSCYARVEYKMWAVPSADDRKSGDGILNRKLGAKLLEEGGRRLMRETKPGPGAASPEANRDTPVGVAGTLRALDDTGAGFWVHPSAVRALLPYVQDLMLAGHNAPAHALLTEYLAAIDDGMLASRGSSVATALEWSALDAQLGGALERIDGPYDFFGNPAGWVPMLSFETNARLFKSEIEQSIRTLFLVYWIEKTQQRQQKAKGVLTQALAHMDAESTRALADFDAALGRLGATDLQFRTVLGEIATYVGQVEEMERDLRRQTAGKLQLERTLRNGAKILGGIAQMIPVGQPALGAVGKGITVLSDIDVDKPMSSLPKLAGAFSDIAQEKLVPKVSKLFAGLKTAKSDADAEAKKDATKEKFDKAVAKKKLDEKVKKHLDEQKEAKEQVMDAFSSFAVKDEEVEERLQTVLASTPEYTKLVNEIKPLNARKAALMASLVAIMESLDAATGTVLANQLGRIELTSQLDATLDQLNQEALQYAQGMGRRARERLLRYQYYLLKSYQYLMLQDLRELDFRVAKLFDAFAKLLAESPDGSLTDTQFATLRVVFEDQLKQVNDRIITWYQSHPPRQGGEFLVSLSPAQVKALNEPAGRLDIDLMRMGYLDPQQEDIRITDIEAVDVELESPPTNRAGNVTLQYRHSGVSRLRRGGLLFQFRSGDYRVGAETDEGSAYRDDHMFWGTVVQHDGKKQVLKAMRPDPAEESLVRYLTSGDTRDTTVLTSFRPSAWATLNLRRSATPSSYAGRISKLVLRISYVSYAVADSLATVQVLSPDGSESLIHFDRADLNGRADGTGSFIRTYDTKTGRHVKVRAPASYGARTFIGWRIGADPSRAPAMLPLVKPGSDIAVDAQDTIVRERELSLDLGKQSAYTIEPLFAELAVGAAGGAYAMPDARRGVRTE